MPADGAEVLFGRTRRPVQVETPTFPTFRSSRLEREYQAYSYSIKAMNDMVVGVVGMVMFSVVGHKGWAYQMHVPAAYGVLAIFSFFLPMATRLFNPNDYFILRNRAVTVAVPLIWFYGLRSAVVLSEHTAPPQLLHVILLVRSQVLIHWWLGLSFRLNFRRHALVHFSGVPIAYLTNAKRCRWALDQDPLRWLASLVRIMRRLTMMPLPAADSFPASDVGGCTVTSNFLQLFFGYVLMCYWSLCIELKLRHDFRQRRRVRRLRERALRHNGSVPPMPEPRPWNPGRLHSWHQVWQAALAAIVCWRVAEAAALYQPTG